MEKQIIKMLQYVGEEFVRDARRMHKAEGGFGDVTGNLRSSIGYFILKDGKIIQSNLEGNKEGANAAKRLIGELEKRQGYQLIGVAGMNYATHVESKGLNVISLQSDMAIISLKELAA